jgi:uncharacterized protein
MEAKWFYIVAAMVGSLLVGTSHGAANLAPMATPATSYVSGHETLASLANDFAPRNSGDHRRGIYGNWPEKGTQWVEYDWSQPIATDRIEVYWFQDAAGIRAPTACRLKYWDGKNFSDVPGSQGLGVATNTFNVTTFPEIKTTKLRLEMDGRENFSTGIISWRVLDSGNTPEFPPAVNAGADRVVVAGGKTYLNGSAKTLRTPATLQWKKVSGDAEVKFDDPSKPQTAATVSGSGLQTIGLTATAGDLSKTELLHVTAVDPPPGEHLVNVEMKPYAINSVFWNERLKNLVIHWIPHCVEMLSRTDLPEGSIDNFVQAGNKLAGKPYTPRHGAPWADAYSHNMVESMCLALMLDPHGDAEIIAAQDAMRAKLDEWIPKILSAQESDGYLQTRFTLDARNPGHWESRTRGEHEGYTAGYFIESAIAHYRMTGGKDRRLYDAAIKLADCWDRNIGPPPKKSWYDGHEEIELALVRLAHLVDEVDGPKKGDKYISLSKFLLDCRRNGSEYDQSHVPVVQQYRAAGHAVRAVYCYSAMTDIAMETRDVDYTSATLSLWDSLVNRALYVTGGVGSGETSEGFGKDYALPNRSYCESCANCGYVFFQHRMNLLWHDAKYADLYEDTLYNAVLGDVDLEGKNFTYTNELDSDRSRYLWHNCPCCVGNIPRTLLQLPTWMYAAGKDSLYVNLFVGSTVSVDVAGTNVKMVQETDYPWKNRVAITLNPQTPAKFTLCLRVPNRSVSTLYSAEPQANGITSITVNGETISPKIERGYAMIDREWKTGDKVELVLPMKVQRIRAIDKVAADRGKVAIRYGPLLYNVESVDQNVQVPLSKEQALAPKWHPDLLGGVIAITGDNFLAVPNYARNNRGGRSLVWMTEQ